MMDSVGRETQKPSKAQSERGAAQTHGSEPHPGQERGTGDDSTASEQVQAPQPFTERTSPRRRCTQCNTTLRAPGSTGLTTAPATPAGTAGQGKHHSAGTNQPREEPLLASRPPPAPTCRGAEWQMLQIPSPGMARAAHGTAEGRRNPVTGSSPEGKGQEQLMQEPTPSPGPLWPPPSSSSTQAPQWPRSAGAGTPGQVRWHGGTRPPYLQSWPAARSV